METEKVFVDGLIFKAPDEKTKEKAPWIKGRISVKVPEFINFLKKYETKGGWVNIDLKKSKEKGTLYLELNQWTPKKDDLDLDDKKVVPIIDPTDGRDLTPDSSNPF